MIAGTAAYVAAEMFGWRRSLDASFDHARRFYLTLGGVVFVAVVIGMMGVPPIKLLFLSGIAGGIATPLTLALMLLVGRNRQIMHRHRIPGWLAGGGWCVTAVVAAATLIYLFQSVTRSGG